MQQIADFHIHSRFSRACSKELTISNLDKACRIKGVDIIGTGDFTFPDWIEEIKNELEEIKTSPQPSPGSGEGGTGLYKLKTAIDDKIKFILTTEVALIYSKAERCRRIHIVIHAPNIEAVEKLNAVLDKKYNIRSDGRPILGMSVEALMKLCLSIHPKFLIYPAHIWTPWFSVFGSKSGFDSIVECFGEYEKDIFAYETGLSSDPAMNWRLSALDKLTLLSNSDAHSLPNIAREANVFDLEKITYDEIYDVIRRQNKSKSSLKYTIEFYPEEGMYHYDGHRDCGVRFLPTETKKHKGLCSKCKKPVTVGVDYRVDELADRKIGFKPAGVPDFKKLVELDKIIAEAIGVKARNSKKVKEVYSSLVNSLGTELSILMDASLEKIKETSNEAIAEGVKRVRAGNLIIEPGFDGQYGVVRIFSDQERRENKQQKLF